MVQITRKSCLRVFVVICSAVFFGLLSTAFLNKLTGSLFISMVVGSIFTFGSYLYLGLRYKLSKFGKAVIVPQAISISLAVSLFLFTIPLNVDRSISVWLLARFTNGDQLSQIDIQKQAVYFFENTPDEVNRRINEQVKIKNLKLNSSGNYELTTQGGLTRTFFKIIADVFSLQKKYANGE